MPHGWGILPLAGVHVYGEVTIVQRFYAFVYEGQCLGRDRSFYVDIFVYWG